MNNIIFDLDLTLIDSKIAENKRKQRDWNAVYKLISKFKLYDGLKEVFNFIHQNKIEVIILSSAPKPYVQKVCNHFNIPYNHILGYYDYKKIKPDPSGMIKAKKLFTNSNSIIAFGDKVSDIIAAQSAGIKSAACYWGTEEANKLQLTNSDYSLYKPINIIKLIKNES